MSAVIINNTPSSGEFTEKHFGKNFNSTLWVRFIDNEFEEWIACFSKSYDRALSKVLTNENNTTCFVVAGGQGYLIDLKSKVCILELEEHPLIESVIKTLNPDYFIAGTFYSVYILNNYGLYKEVNPEFTVDGIYFKEQIGDKAIGELATAENQYDYNVNFSLNLVTFELNLNMNKGESLVEIIFNRIKKYISANR